jgi:hypothetical protein
MMMRKHWVLGALALTLMGAPVAAQDEAGALAAVEQMFEGMRTANPDMVRAVFAEDARFVSVRGGDGPATISASSPDRWITGIGDSDGKWNEQIYDVRVLVDGNVASVWAPFTFYFEGSISHCGINSIELLKDAEGWKVTQLSDTRSEEDCPDPLGG